MRFCLLEFARRSGDAQGRMIQVGFVREDNVAEDLVSGQLPEITGTKSVDEFLVVGTVHKGPATDHGQPSLVCDLYRHCEALQAGVTTIVNNCVRAGRAAMRRPAVRIAESNVIRRRLQRVADRIVTGDHQCRRLVSVNQQQCQT